MATGLGEGEADAGGTTPGPLDRLEKKKTEPAPTATTTTVAATTRLSGSMENPPRKAILRARG